MLTRTRTFRRLYHFVAAVFTSVCGRVCGRKADGRNNNNKYKLKKKKYKKGIKGVQTTGRCARVYSREYMCLAYRWGVPGGGGGVCRGSDAISETEWKFPFARRKVGGGGGGGGGQKDL